MSKTIKSVRGMNDLLPPESAKWLYFEGACRRLFELHGYGEVRTPILESTALFSRGVGESTDIVEKQMYTFPDRKGRSLTMRPEMTASCVRAFVQHGVGKQNPVSRWYYIGPMFRYERVQTGRYRQFYQIGVECYGIAEPTIDAEQIAMLYTLYSELGVPGLEVVINSVGTAEDRPAYRAALVAYLEPKKEALCADCKRRLETNPLRILDCKVPTCKEQVQDPPSILDHLGEASKAHFDGVKSTLDLLGVPYTVDPRMVRGLDYYTGPVFELMSTSGELGAQNTITAGGRYDGLVESLGGPPTPAVGFAIGIERVLLSIPADADELAGKPDVFIASRGDAARAKAMTLGAELRSAGLRVDVEHRTASFKSQFKRADKLGARFVATIGESELEAGEVRLKNMADGEQRAVPFADLAAALSE